MDGERTHDIGAGVEHADEASACLCVATKNCPLHVIEGVLFHHAQEARRAPWTPFVGLARCSAILQKAQNAELGVRAAIIEHAKEEKKQRSILVGLQIIHSVRVVDDEVHEAKNSRSRRCRKDLDKGNENSGPRVSS